MSYYGIRSVTSHTFQDRNWLALLRAGNGGRQVQGVYTRLAALPDVAASPVLDLLGARYFVTDPSDPVFGRPVALSPPEGTVQLRPNVPVVNAIPAGDVRAVGVQVMAGITEPDPGARLLVEVLDGSGRVVTGGSRRLGAPVNRGVFTIPVVEVQAAGTGEASPSVRITLQGSSGSLPVAADDEGRPSLSLVRGGEDGLQLVFVEGAQIYRRLGALPRIRWAGRAEVVEDSSERLFVLSAPVAPDVVVLNEPGPAGSGKSATVRVLRDGDDEVRASVSANGAGYLVIADSLQHGWKAFVDGRPVRLLFAEHALAAVPVPAGRHEVRLRYDPKSWRVGLIISAISVVVLLGALLFPRPMRRRDRTAA
jgi:hypothetical protein